MNTSLFIAVLLLGVLSPLFSFEFPEAKTE